MNRMRLFGCLLILCGLLPAPLAAAAANSVVSGRIVDSNAHPIAGLVVVVVEKNELNEIALVGDRAPEQFASFSTATAADGTFELPKPAGSRYLLDVFGNAQGFATFHGVYGQGTSSIGTLSLIAPTKEERAVLAHINNFRNAPGGQRRYGQLPGLVFDQNLMLSARFWAQMERRAGRIGHTCAALGNPSGCVEFNAFFHGLPGAPQDWFSGQNAAFDSDTAWNDPENGFEDEGRYCNGAYNWHDCSAAPKNAETGHFINLMAASRWVGFGKTTVPGEGAYFAMNVI